MSERAPSRALLVIVDAQRVFLQPTPWHVPGFAQILTCLTKLASAFSGRTICSRYVLPHGGGRGTWHDFYRAWEDLSDDPTLWDLVPEVANSGPLVISKSVYSCFGARSFVDELERRHNPPLLVAGVETDCCVQATVLDAVDAGIAVSVVEDAVASPDPVAHAGALAAFRRLTHQVRVITASELGLASRGEDGT
jgi:nicotinamidase-related amidase